MRLVGIGTLAALMTFAQPVFAEFVDGEAFGIRMGTRTTELDVAFFSASADPSIRLYRLKTVPKPYPLLDTYYAHSSDEIGVCSVSGNTASRSAARIDELEKGIREELAGSFGQPELESHPIGEKLVEAWKKALGHSDLGYYADSYRRYTWHVGSLTRRVTLHRHPPSPNTIVKPGHLEHRIEIEVEFRNYEDCVKEGRK